MFAEEAIMMIPGWNAFPQTLQQALLHQSRVRSEKAGSIVFHQGAEGNCLDAERPSLH